MKNIEGESPVVPPKVGCSVNKKKENKTEGVEFDLFNQLGGKVSSAIF